MDQTHHRYLLVLSELFIFEWIVLAISPLDRAGWMLENIIVIAFVVVLAIT